MEASKRILQTEKSLFKRKQNSGYFKNKKMLQRAVLIIPVKNIRNSSKHF